MSEPIHLPGTTLEGGGQLLRLATTLSALATTTIHITSIRGNRSGGGGLKAQHLTSVQWLGAATHARISGAGLKSKEIMFTPRTPMLDWRNGGEINIKQNTPGSVNLVLQAILPFILFSSLGTEEHGGEQEKVRVRITGGTNVSNSPSCDYIAQVLVPMLALIGIPSIETNIQSRGWSQGGTKMGSATYTVTPLSTPLPAFQLEERGEVRSVKATVIAPRETEERFREELDFVFERREERIFGTGRGCVDVEVTFEDSKHEKRYYLLLVATTTTGIKLGRDWLYNHGVRAGKTDAIPTNMVKKVADDLVEEIAHGGCVDEYMRDQLVVFQALAVGKSSVYGGKRNNGLVEPSLHAKTAQWVAREVIGVEFDDEGGCNGISFGAEEAKQTRWTRS